MAMDRDVTIDFNADISGYSSSMTQMLAQTQQYTAAADNMIGKIGKLNSVVLAGIRVTSGFTQANKTATAQAASYQQQLSKIQTSATLTNKNFKDLEKTTKGLAKEFPIGMGKAVEQVESLQEAGVTTNKEIGSLAKTFTRLGAATGTYGAEIGKDMIQLSRTFQHGTDTMESYADSLTSVTAKYGANAGAVTNFAKSIAPIASTVGVTETQVIGLSTAFSRLGEDGYASANAFNKVMIDMNKSIREGTPEAKLYAEVMGTTTDKLKETWESNPSEGFIQFVESIQKQGANGIRSLEQLGFEGLRTQKSLTALSGSGNIREIVETAQKSYGGGSTAKGAEEAFSGVNDQLTMLNETMAQTASAAGKPFLGFLEKVLQVANALSGAIDKLAGNAGLGQLMKWGGIVAGGVVAARTVGAWTGMAAMGENAVRGAMGSRAARGFTAGRRDPMEFLTRPAGQASRAELMGARYANYFGPGGGVGIREQLGRGARGITNLGGNLAGMWYEANTRQIMKAMGETMPKTPQGQRIAMQAQRLQNYMSPTAMPGLDAQTRARIGQHLMGDISKSIGEAARAPGGVPRALRAFGDQTSAAGRYWARPARAGLGMLSQGAGALLGGPVGIGIAGVTAGAALYGKWRSGEQEGKEAVERGRSDAYHQFNEFAEKAGIATKGLVSFAAALTESTSKIAATGTKDDAGKITDEEKLQAMSPGYEAAYKARQTHVGSEDPMKEAVRIRGMLGPNASKEAINRVQMDLVKELGVGGAENVMKEYKGLEGKSSQEIQTLLEGYARSSDVGPWNTKEGNEFRENAAAEATRRDATNKEMFGTDAVELGKAVSGAKQWAIVNEEFNKPGGGDRDVMHKAMQDAVSGLELNADEKRQFWNASAAGKIDESMTMAESLRAAGLENRAAYVEQQELKYKETPGGLSGVTEDTIKATSVSQREKDAETSTKAMQDVGGEAGTVATELSGLSKVVRESGSKSFEEWSEAGMKGASDLQKAYAELKEAPGDIAKQREVARLVTDKALKEGKTGAEVQQIIETAMTSSTGEEMPALQMARQMAAQETAIKEVGKAPLIKQQETITKGTESEELLRTQTNATQEQKDIWQQDIDAGKAAQLQQAEMMSNFHKQMTRMQEDYGTNVSRMNRNFAQQQQYAQEDYQRQMSYSRQDYHRNVERAEEDHLTQRRRAYRDFHKQMTRQSEETAKSIYNPYERIGVKMVTDIAVLQGSLREQNQAMKGQLSGVKKLAGMGLSKDAIDQLNLMGPGMESQVQRMVSDAQGDPNAIKNVNKLIAERLKAGAGIANSEFNKAAQNMKDDFNQSMKDQEKDYDKAMKRQEQDFGRSMKRTAAAFATSQSRAASQHATALADMDADNKKAVKRATEDLTGMGTDFATGFADVQKQFLTDLASLPNGMTKTTKAAITAVLDAELKAIEAANTKAATGGKNAADAEDAAGYDPATGGTGPTGGTGALAWTGGRGTPGAKFGQSGPMWSWHGNKHNGTDISAPGGTPILATRDGTVVTSTFGGWAGQHVDVKLKNGVLLTFAHMSSRAVKVGDQVHDNTILGRVGSTGNSSGNHLHVSARPPGGGDYINPMPYLAKGGIVTKHMQANIGEAGHEAVIPLNRDGARVLAETMVRYVEGSQARTAQVAPHSSQVTNNLYQYDQRTQFNGPVNVQSQDPDDMARKLEAKQRRARLAGKVGSAA